MPQKRRIEEEPATRIENSCKLRMYITIHMAFDDTPASSAGDITRCLQNWRSGHEDALGQLTAVVYRELRRLAGALFVGESGGHTLQPTALVHELYLQLPDVQHIDWQSRAQFLNVAARMMRNILVDHARKRHAAKRGGGADPLIVDPAIEDPALRADVLVVNDALERFGENYPRQSHVVELRFFGGLTMEETAQVLSATGVECSLRTVERDWTFARAWLQNAIGVN
jgi:RNA polymerase sigma factor (TIGR02999 family)